MVGFDPMIMLLLGGLAAGLVVMALLGGDDDDDDDHEDSVTPGSEAEVGVNADGDYSIADDSENDEDTAITVNGDESDNAIETGSGNDVIYGGGSFIIPDGLSEEELDEIEGGVVDGEIVGDFYASGDGDDILYGGDGIDVMLSGDGADVMYGGAGEDDLTDYDLSASELIAAFEGDIGDTEEEYRAFLGLDDAREGDDDTAYGGGGDDEIVLNWGSDLAYGGAGHDYFDMHDQGAEAGADTAYGGGDDDWFDLDDGDTATGGDGADIFVIDGYFNSTPDLDEAPVVITDFNTEVDEAVYVINFDEEAGAYIIPEEAEFITIQDGDDVRIGADIPDADGVLDGEADFIGVIMQNITKAEVDAAIEAGRIASVYD